MIGKQLNIEPPRPASIEQSAIVVNHRFRSRPLKSIVAAAVLLVALVAFIPGWLQKLLWMQPAGGTGVFWTLWLVRWVLLNAAFVAALLYLRSNRRLAQRNAAVFSVGESVISEIQSGTLTGPLPYGRGSERSRDRKPSVLQYSGELPKRCTPLSRTTTPAAELRIEVSPKAVKRATAARSVAGRPAETMNASAEPLRPRHRLSWLRSSTVSGRGQKKNTGSEKGADVLEEIWRTADRDRPKANFTLRPGLLRRFRTALAGVKTEVFGSCLCCNSTIGLGRVTEAPWTPLCLRCQAAADRDDAEVLRIRSRKEGD
jgi:RNA polymerase-binding transcription factor DksA